jgi:drug/metabolite transporter (DMT)-like permease
MSTLLILSLLIFPPLLFAITNLIDHNLVGEHKSGSLMIIGGMFNLIIGMAIWVWNSGEIELQDFLTLGVMFLVLNGVFYTAAMWIYLYVLVDQDASRVTSFFQFIPVCGLLGGYVFLGESLQRIEILSIFLLILGAVFLVFRDGKILFKMAILMIFSAMFFATNDVIFAKFGREMSLKTALVADLFGKGICGILIMFIRTYRVDAWPTFRSAVWLMLANEILCISADLLVDIAKIFIPIAIVQGMSATQPAFVLIIAMVVAKYLPKVRHENFEGVKKWQKIVGISFVVIGGIIVAVNQA